MTSTLLPSFSGVAYRLANNWFDQVPRTEGPINYLEIGTFYGANLISVANSYAAHPDSKMYCIDPWCDYEDYPEYKGKQESTYARFVQNIEANGLTSKVTTLRGFSHEKVPTLPDDYFDMIYVDGNHEPEYVLEDAVLCFRKLKVGGYMIFDDYGWGGPDLTKRGIDGFLNGYHKRIRLIRLNKESQTFIQKIK
jgi:predicted O-methyltransferase YrrM